MGLPKVRSIFMTTLNAQDFPITHGRTNVPPQIVIREDGLVVFNSKATAALTKVVDTATLPVNTRNEKTGGVIYSIKIYARWESESRILKFSLRKAKDEKETSAFSGRYQTGGKQTLATIAFGKVLTALGYDFDKSGPQPFKVSVEEKSHEISMVLPEGALTRRPVTPRKKREKKAESTDVVAPTEQPELVEA